MTCTDNPSGSDTISSKHNNHLTRLKVQDSGDKNSSWYQLNIRFPHSSHSYLPFLKH